MSFKNNLKTTIFFLLNGISRFLPKDRAAILLYHSVGDDSLYLTVKPYLFERQMMYLKEHNYNVISLKQLNDIIRQPGKISPKTVVLTFDDGLLSHYKNVIPVLEKYNFPATFFVATGYIGQKINNSENKPLNTATWAQLQEMSNVSLFDIEPHGINHLEFDTLSLEETEKEIANSKQEIESKLNKHCGFFAFPRGKFKVEDKKILQDRGFVASVTIEPGLVGNKSNMLILPRNTVDSSCVNDIIFSARLTWSLFLFKKIFKLNGDQGNHISRD